MNINNISNNYLKTYVSARKDFAGRNSISQREDGVYEVSNFQKDKQDKF